MRLPEYFVSCDWGTSSFRLRLVAFEDFHVAAEFRESVGVRSIHDGLADDAGAAERDAAFSGFLGARLERLLADASSEIEVRHVALSGMASSTIGWRELPYALAPLPVDGSTIPFERIPFSTGSGREFELFLISGARTDSDIIRGEETEALGVYNDPRFEGRALGSLMIMPGTHCKHVLTEDRRIVAWRTFLTGELFEALTRHTILRQTTTAPDSEAAPGPAVDVCFREGVTEGARNGMEAGLFQARARGVLSGATSAENRAFLSGVLIGSELRHARQLAAGRPILLTGASDIRERYASAFEILRETESGAEGSVIVDLPEGAAAIQGHAFLLKRWLAANNTGTP